MVTFCLTSLAICFSNILTPVSMRRISRNTFAVLSKFCLSSSRSRMPCHNSSIFISCSSSAEVIVLYLAIRVLRVVILLFKSSDITVPCFSNFDTIILNCFSCRSTSVTPRFTSLSIRSLSGPRLSPCPCPFTVGGWLFPSCWGCLLYWSQVPGSSLPFTRQVADGLIPVFGRMAVPSVIGSSAGEMLG